MKIFPSLCEGEKIMHDNDIIFNYLKEFKEKECIQEYLSNTKKRMRLLL